MCAGFHYRDGILIRWACDSTNVCGFAPVCAEPIVLRGGLMAVCTRAISCASSPHFPPCIITPNACVHENGLKTKKEQPWNKLFFLHFPTY